MSNSMAMNESLNSSRFATNGQKTRSFSQTCNLLSQYVKDKRAFGMPNNLDHATTCAGSEGYSNISTMNLFPVKQVDDSNNASLIGRTINLFPQISGFNSSAKKRASPEPSAAQMTIFYGGQVVVFNDISSDKANEVMNMASSFESSLKIRKLDTPASHVPVSVRVPNANSVVNQNSNPNQPQTQNLATGSPNFGTHVPVTAALPRPSVLSADLPIARKASLHRFLEKRKDRLVGKAPSSTTAPIEGGAKKPLESKAWLGLNSLPVFQQQHQ